MGTNTLSLLNEDGALQQRNNSSNPSAGLAVDAAGNFWALSTSGNVLYEFNAGSTSSNSSSGGGLNQPKALAVDGLGQVWVANGNGTVSAFANDSTPITGPSGYQTNSSGAATGVAIDTSGSVWVSSGATL